MHKDVNVKVPKAMADAIQKTGHLKLYSDLDEFVVDCVRRRMEELMGLK